MEVISGYKQTTLGTIPADWTDTQLGEIGEALIGLTYSPANVRSHGLLVLRSSNVADGTLRFEDNVFVDLDVPDKIIVKEGDILLCARNGSRDLIGKCARIDKRAAGMTFGAFMAVFRTRYHNFVFHQFQSDILKRQIREHLGATINQITNASLNAFRIPFPDSDEERGAIASALDDADDLIVSLGALIAKQRNVRQAVMQQLLTGQIRLPGFDVAWETKRVRNIGVFGKGKGIRKDQVLPEGLPCVRYGEIYTRHNDSIRRFYSFISSEVARQSQRLSKGDLLFTGSGETAEDIGKCVAFLGDEEAYAGGDIVILSPDGQDSLFLGYLMNHATVVEQKAQMAQGDAVVHISARNLGEVEVRLPHLDEQTAIAAALSDMDSEIAALEARRDKTRALKHGMMQTLLTGRTRLV